MTAPTAPQDGAPRAGFVPTRPRLAYSRAGTGAPIVFLHGVGGSRDNWRAQLAHFSSRWQAVAWDARGYGDSDDYDGPCRFEDFSDDLAALLDHLGADRAHLVGLSMGGRILMDFADRHPSRVRSLTLAASFPSFGTTLTPAQQDDFMRRRRIPLESGVPLSEMAPSLLATLLGPNASQAAHDEALRSITKLHVPSYLKVLEATLRFDRTEALRRVTAPVLLLFGELDTLVTPRAGADVHAMVPHARMAVLPGVGHLLNLEAPEAFNAQLEAFLRSLEN